MLEPFDQLTEEDKKTISEYISSYAHCKVIDLAITLREWNKSKKRLWRALGKNLRIKVPISIRRDAPTYERMLMELYSLPSISDYYNGWDGYVESFYTKIANGYEKDFVIDVTFFLDDLYKREKITPRDLAAFFWILSYSNVIRGHTGEMDYCWFAGEFRHERNNYIFNYGDKCVKIMANLKIMKTIRKILELLGYDRMDLFEDFRNKLSDLSTGANINTNLVLSIHPLDFMTLSDNNCSWSSCMSWTDDGSYSNGTIEMMNSNIVAVAYLESSTPYMFNCHSIPNKSWRTLVYVHKDIIVSGKAYPYTNSMLSREVIKQFAKLVKDVFNWTYQYKDQNYLDLCNYNCNSAIYNYTKYGKKAILIRTNGMYNDLVEDHDYDYWCYRNYVPHTKIINASGKNTCLMCGEKNYDLGSKVKYCDTCQTEYFCTCCSQLKFDSNCYTINVLSKFGDVSRMHVCEECLNEFWYDPDYKVAIKKTMLPKLKENKLTNYLIGSQEDIDKVFSNLIEYYERNSGRNLFSYHYNDILNPNDCYIEVDIIQSACDKYNVKLGKFLLLGGENENRDIRSKGIIYTYTKDSDSHTFKCYVLNDGYTEEDVKNNEFGLHLVQLSDVIEEVCDCDRKNQISLSLQTSSATRRFCNRV